VIEEPSYISFARVNVKEGLLTSTSVVRELLARIDRDAATLKALESQP